MEQQIQTTELQITQAKQAAEFCTYSGRTDSETVRGHATHGKDVHGKHNRTRNL